MSAKHRGRGTGDDDADWLDADRELTREELGETIQELASRARVPERSKQAVYERVKDTQDRAADAAHRAADAAHRVRNARNDVWVYGAASAAVGVAVYALTRRRAPKSKGNPLYRLCVASGR
ncbi:uncharacterized protein DUF3618 [Saccharopolyspora erythraea NRRL 2338]|uniref:Uncharacterized protein n=2 Tax=Saccharopolyspora erythraea TaxID=1836 RepID=A4FH99_SACEN|nr:DUF3618 domain-containing protein [Saccharopolyspora erythraea]EQD86872.1 hypothetical protein N599_07270 [Saccharopolyspora erythraea D]PFG97124.1 uncharacterized protein DUF3618 [Saccharopolyspora erythraea NRRL 2338]QRK87327.1 DUF3618 domain-containing protein [Saccharopolyspora erythraea]CAM03424.1 hypothetical protein SACE_4155 [Saccharopolyspora erythraea NRRL 2338]